MPRMRNSEAPVLKPVASATTSLSRTQPLPSWEELAVTAVNLDAGYRARVTKLKDGKPAWGYRIARTITKFALHEHVYQKFLDFTWHELVELMSDQVARNRLLGPDGTRDAGAKQLQDRTDLQFFRSYAQMPCTRDTAIRRVRKAEELVGKEEPILLLGDDDMVSVELAAAGFTNVTAVDIDQRVLDQIAKEAKERGLAIRLVQHDLSRPMPDTLQGEYGLVMFDPEYSVAGVRMFMGSALEAVAGRKGTHLFLSVHLMSLMRGGLAQLERYLESCGVEVLQVHQGFNVYPVPGRLKSLIHLVNRFVIGSKTLTTEGFAFPYFLSDVIILRKT